VRGSQFEPARRRSYVQSFDDQASAIETYAGVCAETGVLNQWMDLTRSLLLFLRGCSVSDNFENLFLDTGEDLQFTVAQFREQWNSPTAVRYPKDGMRCQFEIGPVAGPFLRSATPRHFTC
jgi:hypothetical protein